MIQVPGEFYCPFSGKKPPLSAKNLDLNCKSACHLVYSLQLLLNVVSSTSKASFWAAPAGIAGYRAKAESVSDEPADIIFDNTNFFPVYHSDMMNATREMVIWIFDIRATLQR